MKRTKPSEGRQNYQWFDIKYAESFDSLQNYQSFRIEHTKPSEGLRNYQWFGIKYAKL